MPGTLLRWNAVSAVYQKHSGAAQLQGVVESCEGAPETSDTHHVSQAPPTDVEPVWEKGLCL